MHSPLPTIDRSWGRVPLNICQVRQGFAHRLELICWRGPKLGRNQIWTPLTFLRWISYPLRGQSPHLAQVLPLHLILPNETPEE